MTRLRALCAVAMLAALVSVANAQTVHFAAAGSSAMFQGFAVSTVNLVAPATLGGSGATSIHHYTFNSANCPGAGCPAVLRDPRVNASAPPLSDAQANIWVG